MFKSYINNLLLLLIAVAVIAIYLLIEHSQLNYPLLPVKESAYPWSAVKSTDAHKGGTSTVSIIDDTNTIDFNYNLTSGFQYSYASIGIVFADITYPNTFVDWSQFTTLALKVRCTPRNVLNFALYTFDEQVSKPNDFSTFRTSIRVFPCDETWSNVDIDLQHLDTPEWWLLLNGMDVSNKDYALNKIYSFTIVNSSQSPVDTLSNVKIESATLSGQDKRFIYAAYTLAFFALAIFVLWLFRQYTLRLTTELKLKMQQDQPLLAYRQLPLESKKDREKNAVLHYMATEYANPDLSLDTVMSALGINRAKINDILREHQGLTFSTYLNKIRLTEASRLLLEQEASVAETAYSVGYNNPSYFNRIFKKEYGCTPNSFKKYMTEGKTSK